MKLSNLCFYPWQSNLYQSRPPAKHNYKTEQSVQDNFFPGIKKMVNEGLQALRSWPPHGPSFPLGSFLAAVQGGGAKKSWSLSDWSQWGPVLAHVELESQRKMRKRREYKMCLKK